MQQLSIEYFYPLTEQIDLHLDYSPCLKYEEDKRRNSLYVGNRIDQWGLTANVNMMTSSVMINPSLVIYPEKVPIVIKTESKPNILARWIYKILGAKWEKA